MKLKLKIIIFIVLLLSFVSTVKTTYSRYVSEASGNVTANIANWKVKVNNTDITASTSNTVSITPQIVSNSNVKSGKIAPGSEGYFDIVVDPSDVDVSYTMSISASSSSGVTDLKFKKWGWKLGTSYTATNETNLSGTTASVSRIWKLSETSNLSSGKFSPYIVRVYFYWDDTTGSMNDAADTQVGLNAANGTSPSTSISVTLSFTQYTGA